MLTGEPKDKANYLKGLYKYKKGECKVFKIFISGIYSSFYIYFGTKEEVDQMLVETKEELKDVCNPDLIQWTVKDITNTFDLDYRYRG